MVHIDADIDGEAEHEEPSHLLLNGGDLGLDLRSLVLRDVRLWTSKELFVDV